MEAEKAEAVSRGALPVHPVPEPDPDGEAERVGADHRQHHVPVKERN